MRPTLAVLVCVIGGAVYFHDPGEEQVELQEASKTPWDSGQLRDLALSTCLLENAYKRQSADQPTEDCPGWVMRDIVCIDFVACIEVVENRASDEIALVFAGTQGRCPRSIAVSSAIALSSPHAIQASTNRSLPRMFGNQSVCTHLEVLRGIKATFRKFKQLNSYHPVEYLVQRISQGARARLIGHSRGAVAAQQTLVTELIPLLEAGVGLELLRRVKVHAFGSPPAFCSRSAATLRRALPVVDHNVVMMYVKHDPVTCLQTQVVASPDQAHEPAGSVPCALNFTHTGILLELDPDNRRITQRNTMVTCSMWRLAKPEERKAHSLHSLMQRMHQIDRVTREPGRPSRWSYVTLADPSP